MTQAAPESREDLKLRLRFEEFRGTRTGRTRLPEILWQEAAKGARRYGVNTVFAAFEHDILRDRVRAGLNHARQSGTRLGRPATATIKAAEVRKLFRQGISKSEISRRLDIGITSVRRILAQNKP